MSMSSTVSLACQLIKKESITPYDKGCQNIIAERLKSFGFSKELIKIKDVDNLWLKRNQSKPLLVLAGHTDVVPPGPLKKWLHPPFTPTIEQGMLYGRGAADMKGGLAAMIVAVENFITKHKNHAGSIAFLITSDEEGKAINGTRKVVDILKERNEIPQWCIIGEPSSSESIGDVVKHGRRGSLSGILTIEGIQGHVAYPQLASNPIHKSMAVLDALIKSEWDHGNKDFPPTSFQIVSIKSSTDTINVIPGSLQITFNFRYSTETTEHKLKNKVLEILNEYDLIYNIEWILSGHPFLTPEGKLTLSTAKAIQSVTGKKATFNTAGGTSDGRFIAKLGTEIVELGLCNKTIHSVNECTSIKDLDTLTLIYEKIIEQLLL